MDCVRAAGSKINKLRLFTIFMVLNIFGRMLGWANSGPRMVEERRTIDQITPGDLYRRYGVHVTQRQLDVAIGEVDEMRKYSLLRSLGYIE